MKTKIPLLPKVLPLKVVTGLLKRETKPAPVKPAVVAQAPRLELIPPISEEENIKFAMYRADAIARDIEQRRDENRERNPHHGQMIAEAMRHAWFAVEHGAWTVDQVDKLRIRLAG